MKPKISLTFLILALVLSVGGIAFSLATNHNPLILFQSPYYMTAGGGTAVRLTHSGGQISYANDPDRWFILPIPHLNREGLGVNGQWVANRSIHNGEICVHQMNEAHVVTKRCVPQDKLDSAWIPNQLVPSIDGRLLAIEHTIDRVTTCPGSNLLAFTVSVYNFDSNTITTLTHMAYGPQFSPSNGRLGYIEVTNFCQNRRFVLRDLYTGEVTYIEPSAGFAFRPDGTVVETEALVDPYVHPILFRDQLVFTMDNGLDVPETISIDGNESSLSLEMAAHELVEWDGHLYISYFDTAARNFNLIEYSP